MKLLLVPVIALLTLGLPQVNSQCVSFSTSFSFDGGAFFPNPGLIFYELESELFLAPGLAAIAEVNVNYSSTVARGGASVTIEYQTSDARSVGFTYDNATAGCQTGLPNNQVVCDLGSLGILQNPGSNSGRITPALALAAIALYAQGLSSSLVLAGVVLAPGLVAAQTCSERLVITITLAEIEDTVLITPSVLTDSIKFRAQCKGGNAACNNNILDRCQPCV